MPPCDMPPYNSVSLQARVMSRLHTLGLRALAWGGGLLFVASLCYGVWVYAVRLVEVPDGTSVAPAVAVAVNLLLFLLFASHHSLMARSAAKVWISRIVGPGFERSVYVWVASLLFLGMCALWQPIAGHAWQLHSPWNWLGRAVQVIGLLIIVRAAPTLRLLAFAGIRPSSSASPAAPQSAQREADLVVLTTEGPYDWVRHPIYLGTLLLLAGTPDMNLGRFAFVVATAVYVVVAVRWEERSLVESFGEAYVRYQRRVRWRIVPFVY